MQNTTFEQNPITLTFPEKFYTKKGLQRYYKIISEPEYIPEEESYTCENEEILNINKNSKILEIII
jgi:hypothetical protein